MDLALCEKCSGYLPPGEAHVCNPDEVELTTLMRNAEIRREGKVRARALELAAELLSRQKMPEAGPVSRHWAEGYQAAIRDLKHEADAIRAALPPE